MKKLSVLILAFIALLSFNACSSDDDVVFIAQPDPEGISFTNSFAASYTLTPATADNIAERFVWNLIDVDVPTNIVYELQGSTSQEFEAYDPVASTSGNNVGISVKQLMDLAAEAGLDNDPETEEPNTGSLYFRVVASPGTAEGLTHTSEVQTLTVVLPEATGEETEVFRNLYLVGDATAAGWDPTNNTFPLFRDAENSDLYHYTGRFAGGADVEGFKLLENPSWSPQWGISDGTLSNNIILGGDPLAFPVSEDAYYSFEVNVDEMTYSFEAFDESEATTYEVIGLVGAGTSVGWPDDNNPTPDILLTQSEFDAHIWYVKGIELSDGPIKLRADQEWETDWGGNTFPSGQAVIKGSDINATPGTYDLWFNDITGHYILIPQEDAAN